MTLTISDPAACVLSFVAGVVCSLAVVAIIVVWSILTKARRR